MEQDECLKHFDQKDVFCETCQQVICYKCLTQGDHNGHKGIDLDLVNQSKSILADNEQIEARIDQYQQQIILKQKEENKLVETKKAYLLMIETQKNIILQKLEQHQKDQRTQFEKAIDSLILQNQIKLEKYKQEILRIQNAQTMLQNSNYQGLQPDIKDEDMLEEGGQSILTQDEIKLTDNIDFILDEIPKLFQFEIKGQYLSNQQIEDQIKPERESQNKQQKLSNKKSRKVKIDNLNKEQQQTQKDQKDKSQMKNLLLNDKRNIFPLVRCMFSIFLICSCLAYGENIQLFMVECFVLYGIHL